MGKRWITNNITSGNPVIAGNATFSANYNTQFLVTILAPPEANATPSGWYDAGPFSFQTAPMYVSNGIVWSFFRFTGTNPASTSTVNLQLNGLLTDQAEYVRDISASMNWVRSGLTYNRGQQVFYGTITITNTSAEIYSNALPLVLKGLPRGVTLVNAAGVFRGDPYVQTPGANGFQPGASLTVPVQFKIPAGTNLNYTPQLLSFH